MKKNYKKSLICFIAFVMCFVMMPKTVYAEDATTTFTTNILFHQTEARETVDLVNEFRTSEDAWYWNKKDSEKFYPEDLKTLTTTSPAIEKLAMQRAVEIALSLTHTRTDGSDYDSIWKDYKSEGYFTCNENIAVGFETGEEAVEFWKESTAKYSGQGHRRAMLGDWNEYACACVEVDGTKFWVQIFAVVDEPQVELEAPVDTKQDWEVTVLNSMVKNATIGNSFVQLKQVGDSIKVPQLELSGISTTSSWWNTTIPATLDVSWTSSDSNVAAIDDGKIVAKSAGITTLTTTAFGKDFSIDVIVECTVMYRLYNPNSGEHFYTAKPEEKDMLVGIGWNNEGTGWIAPKTGEPVYRLYNPNAGDHHYTSSEAEKDSLVKAGWNYESVGWYSDVNQSIPLYRQYNPNAVSGAHNYTTSKAENDALVKLGWKEEGIGWYGVS